ncbi:NAD-dependent epimerase/dehydratase family protein [Corallococcus carmarthensis]|uniref:NAD-dependent epimerase/dehydratase family protein n=1 Tax=Corallococcus carmarthensis TaxID=2316728 RepID=A0A3A8KRI1_9BACT|nr:NAD-dependent epimerase/dehydratase family protein [Corallococcus carmarthensis]NOK17755.1 NAD-dependent epimerase/dehydratase family protein [Corallococcus carmarthensis]RKH04992.1 NAD-dependent epimerase/dehydratase family protein [Corallococcus carmarthensis]
MGRKHILILGGAGFIGSNVADHYLQEGRTVRVLDNVSRPGVERNLRWLRERHGERLRIEVADTRDLLAVRRAVRDASEVFHFAAQVVATQSRQSPFHDFDVNARGTLHVLEALRELETPPPLVFTSTSKVYGGLKGLELAVRDQRYAPMDDRTLAHGISEACPLDFESPYGCSKGAADQYVLDYARTFGLPAVVFRMSSIYGPRQSGTEDQAWVAHLLQRALDGEPLTFYGDGMQVRDLLYVEDLVRAFWLAQQAMPRIQGRAFNIGGGPGQTVSLLELLALIQRRTGHGPRVAFEDWRTGDPRYYVSDTRAFTRATGWMPRVGVVEGVARLGSWLEAQQGARQAVGRGESLESADGPP